MTLQEQLNDELAYDANGIIPEALEEVVKNTAVNFLEWFLEDSEQDFTGKGVYDLWQNFKMEKNL